MQFHHVFITYFDTLLLAIHSKGGWALVKLISYRLVKYFFIEENRDLRAYFKMILLLHKETFLQQSGNLMMLLEAILTKVWGDPEMRTPL